MKRRIWIHALFVVISTMTMLFILSVPYNRFEWMQQDPHLIHEKLDFCSLPLDDSEPALDGFLYLFPMLLITGIGIVIAIRRHTGFPSSVGYTVFLLTFWGWRFFVAAPHCP